jgi:hypothetical protein
MKNAVKGSMLKQLNLIKCKDIVKNNKKIHLFCVNFISGVEVMQINC